METTNAAVKLMTEKLHSWLEGFFHNLPNFIIAILIITFFLFLSSYVYRTTLKVFRKTPFNESLEFLLANFIRICFVGLGIMFALSVLKLDKTVYSMLAGLGVIGLALGFAFQELASNFIAGVMVAIQSPVRINDVIEIDGEIGTVLEIRIRDTLIRNFEGHNILLPNKFFISNKFTNFSSFGKRRITLRIGVGYSDPLEKAKFLIVDAIKNIPGVLSDPAPVAFVDSLGDSSVNLIAHLWINFPEADFLAIKDQGYIKSKLALEAAGLKIPFPIRTLDIPEKQSGQIRVN
jgi:small-conductance mechanosensitive channel